MAKINKQHYLKSLFVTSSLCALLTSTTSYGVPTREEIKEAAKIKYQELPAYYKTHNINHSTTRDHNNDVRYRITKFIKDKFNTNELEFNVDEANQMFEEIKSEVYMKELKNGLKESEENFLAKILPRLPFSSLEEREQWSKSVEGRLDLAINLANKPLAELESADDNKAQNLANLSSHTIQKLPKPSSWYKIENTIDEKLLTSIQNVYQQAEERNATFLNCIKQVQAIRKNKDIELNEKRRKIHALVASNATVFVNAVVTEQKRLTQLERIAPTLEKLTSKEKHIETQDNTPIISQILTAQSTYVDYINQELNGLNYIIRLNDSIESMEPEDRTQLNQEYIRNVVGLLKESMNNERTQINYLAEFYTKEQVETRLAELANIKAAAQADSNATTDQVAENLDATQDLNPERYLDLATKLLTTKKSGNTDNISGLDLARDHSGLKPDQILNKQGITILKEIKKGMESLRHADQEGGERIVQSTNLKQQLKTIGENRALSPDAKRSQVKELLEQQRDTLLEAQHKEQNRATELTSGSIRIRQNLPEAVIPELDDEGTKDFLQTASNLHTFQNAYLQNLDNGITYLNKLIALHDQDINNLPADKQETHVQELIEASEVIIDNIITSQQQCRNYVQQLLLHGQALQTDLAQTVVDQNQDSNADSDPTADQARAITGTIVTKPYPDPDHDSAQADHAHAQIASASKKLPFNELQPIIGRNQMDAAHGMIFDRILPSFSLNATNPQAVASGDDDEKLKRGVWVMGIYGTNKQGQDKNIAAYNGHLHGGIIGADIDLNENNLVGAAYSHILSNYKYKNNQSKKVNAKSNIVSLYSQTQFNEQIIWSNILSAGFSKVKVKDSVAKASGKSELVTGKYNNRSYSWDTKLGYRIPMNDTSLNIVPYIGLKVAQYKDGGYKLGNLSVDSVSEVAVIGKIGANIAKKYQLSADTSIIPALHFSVEKNFRNKAPKVKAKFDSMADYVQSEESKKTKNVAYNIGANLTTQHNNFDIVVGYNCNLQKKYQAHQGYLKLKLAF